MATRAMAYNGWENRSTWAVNLHISNEQGTYEYWEERARDAKRRHRGETEVAVDELGEMLVEWFDDIVSDHFEQAPNLMLQDLMPDRGEINFREIARAILEDEDSEDEDSEDAEDEDEDSEDAEKIKGEHFNYGF